MDFQLEEAHISERMTFLQGVAATQSGALGRIQNATEPIQDARLTPDDSSSRSSESEERAASDAEASTSQPVLDSRTIRQLAGLTTANEVINQVLQLGVYWTSLCRIILG